MWYSVKDKLPDLDELVWVRLQYANFYRKYYCKHVLPLYSNIYALKKFSLQKEQALGLAEKLLMKVNVLSKKARLIYAEDLYEKLNVPVVTKAAVAKVLRL